MQGDNLDITVFHNAAAQAEQAVKAAAALIAGEPVEPVSWVPFELVTHENMASYVQ